MLSIKLIAFWPLSDSIWYRLRCWLAARIRNYEVFRKEQVAIGVCSKLQIGITVSLLS